ncbi:hypothetical protein SISNIDRAFT_496532 [Sistotremastrum niveocremeum HHB9708]|uniref:C2H2-type domain-containing protein n=1 Tax=Sistotremastrum niveocremeum HHB9708 TaxID=1314777 RepID=A0A164SEX8_9AGAM|nr:hypothetical protein SISNIDRAFT_496532 [Sistotremastrum niveocremeum HHB9708]
MSQYSGLYSSSTDPRNHLPGRYATYDHQESYASYPSALSSPYESSTAYSSGSSLATAAYHRMGSNDYPTPAANHNDGQDFASRTSSRSSYYTIPPERELNFWGPTQIGTPLQAHPQEPSARIESPYIPSYSSPHSPASMSMTHHTPELTRPGISENEVSMISPSFGSALSTPEYWPSPLLSSIAGEEQTPPVFAESPAPSTMSSFIESSHPSLSAELELPFSPYRDMNISIGPEYPQQLRSVYPPAMAGQRWMHPSSLILNSSSDTSDTEGENSLPHIHGASPSDHRAAPKRPFAPRRPSKKVDLDIQPDLPQLSRKTVIEKYMKMTPIGADMFECNWINPVTGIRGCQSGVGRPLDAPRHFLLHYFDELEYVAKRLISIEDAPVITAFRSNADLLSKTRVPFCADCGKRLSRPDALKRHLRTPSHQAAVRRPQLRNVRPS